MSYRFFCSRVLVLVAAVAANAAAATAAGNVSASSVADYVSYAGTATALKSHQFLYGEKHVIVARGGKVAERVVLYTCHDGSPFARKTVSYVDAIAPNFALEDASNGMREGLRYEAGGRSVFFRAVGVAAEKTSSVPQVRGLVADAGFDEFVRANWQPLTVDKSVDMQFLVPSRLEDIGFRIEALRSDQVHGVPVQVFRLKPKGVVSWFMTGIDVYYGTSDHILMRYVGLSDLRDAAGSNLSVDIAFDPKDRKAATRDDVERALKARLAPCT